MPFFEVNINNALQAADTATFTIDEPMDFELNPQVQIIGDHRPFGGFINKENETPEGYSYDCIDWTRTMFGKIFKGYHNKTITEIVSELLEQCRVNTGGLNPTKKRYPELIFHSEKIFDVCHQLANLEGKEFFVNPYNIAFLRNVPTIQEGYVFYPPSYSDISLTQDSSNIITSVSAFGEDDKFLAQVKDAKLIAKYGFIEDIITDTSLKTATEGRAAATELFNTGSKIEFSGSITTPLLEKMAAGQWTIIVPPSWSKYTIKSYYTQNVRTTINENTEEQQIDLLNGQPAPLSEWIYEAPGDAKGTFTNNYTLPSEIISVLSDPIALKAKELGDPRTIRRWIDANIQYEFYYDFKYSPVQVLQFRKGNCYDQSLLFVQMVNSLGFSAYRRCGQVCNGYAHCDAMIYMEGRWIQVDTTCASRNQLV